MASTGSNSSVQTPEAADVSGADLVVAVATCNDAATIGPVVRAVCEGLARYFGGTGARILLADGGSTDGTREAAREAAGGVPLVQVVYPAPAALTDLPYHGQPGRAPALRAVLQMTRDLGARACAVIDGAIDGAVPERVKQLVAPVLAGKCDYVSPYYVRRAHEGALTRGIVYPVFRALYGVRLRQPAAGEFGCSAALVAHFLEQEFWELEQAPAGIDLFLTVAAVCGAFRTCETSLGIRRTAPREAPVDVSTALKQVVGALFTEVEDRVDFWQRSRGSVPVPLLGEVPAVAPESTAVPVEAMLESFRLGYQELREIWTWVLPPRTLVELRRLTETAPDRFRFPDRVWADVVYGFALGYALRVMPRDHLLGSLAPLYNGWLASFLLETGGASPAQVDDRVEQLCVGFEAEKRTLIAGWRWPERLRS